MIDSIANFGGSVWSFLEVWVFGLLGDSPLRAIGTVIVFALYVSICAAFYFLAIRPYSKYMKDKFAFNPFGREFWLMVAAWMAVSIFPLVPDAFKGPLTILILVAGMAIMSVMLFKKSHNLGLAAINFFAVSLITILSISFVLRIIIWGFIIAICALIFLFFGGKLGTGSRVGGSDGANTIQRGDRTFTEDSTGSFEFNGKKYR